MDLEPVPDIPALRIREGAGTVCVADLHLGIEVQLRRAGFNIPSQAPKMLAVLEGLRSHGADLVILGDVKHRIPSIGYHEDKVLRPFLDRLVRLYEHVTVVAGNHDGGISAVLPSGVRAVPGSGLRVSAAGLCHGHVWPSQDAMKGRTLVMGHVHPSVLLVDSLGSKTNEKCWLRGGFDKAVAKTRYGAVPDELIVVPAFNPLLTGTPVNSRSGAMLGPVFRNKLVVPESIRAYLLDGTNLGHPKEV